MQFPRAYIDRRLKHERKERRSGRFFLRAAGCLVAMNCFLVGYNLWRGWRTADFLYAFILVVWLGFFVVQRKILERKREQVDRLTEALHKA